MVKDKKGLLIPLLFLLIGILIRILIMPISFHGPDIFYVNYFPFKYIEGKVEDPYLYLKTNFPEIKTTYYPPGILYILAPFHKLFRPLLPKLKELYSVFSLWCFNWEGNTVNFADILIDYQLFRTLFLFKIPYLISDVIIAFIIYKILKENKKALCISFLAWAVNPFALHSVYALGQFDIIVAMFIALSLLAVKAKRLYWAVTCLSLGAGVKIIPLLLLPPAIIILGRSFKEHSKLIFVSFLIFISFFIPLFRTSGLLAFEIFKVSSLAFGIATIKRDIFICAYLAFIIGLFFFRKKEKDKLEACILYFSSVLLLFYAIYDVTLRYFVWVTPLLILLARHRPIFWIYNAIFFITLFELRASGNTQLGGLFAALHPEFFSSLPIPDSYLNLIINVKYIHQLMYRLFILSSLTMVAHMLIAHKWRKELSFP